jgi:Aldehyde dehydrogenase family
MRIFLTLGFFLLLLLQFASKMSFLWFLLKVVQVAVRAALQSSGQNCAGAERFYVHKDIYPEFVAQIVKVIKSISVVSMCYSLILLYTGEILQELLDSSFISSNYKLICVKLAGPTIIWQI